MIPARTNNCAVFFPYNSPMTSVMRKTNGNENTLTESVVSNTNGINLSPSVFAANNDVR
jgi:hypothetical protein